jgi:hypothetical protein
LAAPPHQKLRRPLGIAIVGRLLLWRFLTLYTTPVIYISAGSSDLPFAEKARQNAGPDSPAVNACSRLIIAAKACRHNRPQSCSAN